MKRQRLTRSNRAYYEQFIEQVEKARSHTITEADVERILNEMQSEDEVTRAHAVREICPCRMPPEVFYRLRKAAKPLQKDPSPLVRSNAFHIEDDARMVESIESALERLKDREEEMDNDLELPKRRHKRPRITSH